MKKIGIFLIIFVVSILASGIIPISDLYGSGTCICTERRSWYGSCVGETTRFCQGPPECIDACQGSPAPIED